MDTKLSKSQDIFTGYAEKYVVSRQMEATVPLYLVLVRNFRPSFGSLGLRA